MDNGCYGTNIAQAGLEEAGRTTYLHLGLCLLWLLSLSLLQAINTDIMRIRTGPPSR